MKVDINSVLFVCKTSSVTHKTELTDEDKKKLEYIDDNRRAYLSMDPRKTKR